ncbi:cyclic nucleotide-binding domain-containing protein [Aetokthonos hydrillicola Thurmond2011]|jgi:CRP-like cAMP-binding protein|uniref:Cyclic nucleotide-binding domain-containing protein n=1 Tax=Aetokthonos hydrillicola Thurmond2011 TaxID=2712845 RepID=A0AAP5IE05_9CYAN|nr:cyclic nucleotide-binding domain-containing protein [Aetokthonos hydrillicola]MBO3464440.1 cyclic nucleotide-binding domain-containing protein [Aetokthonos hydrillicola CCALA 1050]MBW4586373.1 cyclic nucleotide-binding domain-containing protein [Aetokthonos hydrillicola CCALA 1050]MDR9899921.1 cyclic nucleotide-binding domain-containing protein [Aetokthonos hydrillicola Thurmond2011]
MLQPAQTISIFQKQPDPKVFVAGQIIFEEGQPGDYMYGILEGEVDLSVDNKIVETIAAGEVFGTGSLVGIKNRTYTAIAKTDCKLAFLDEQRFLFAIQETPIFALLVMKSYSQRLSRLEHQI